MMKAALADFKTRLQSESDAQPLQSNTNPLGRTQEGLYLEVLGEHLQGLVEKPGQFLVETMFPTFVKRGQEEVSRSEATFLEFYIARHGGPGVRYRMPDGRGRGLEHSTASRYPASPGASRIPRDPELENLQVITWSWRTNDFKIETALEAQTCAFQWRREFRRQMQEHGDDLALDNFGFMTCHLVDVTTTRAEAEGIVQTLKKRNGN
jgi:hypothetical protein